MHCLRYLLVLAVLLASNLGHAAVIRNLEGKVSGLTNLNVGGAIYDIQFGDGVVGDAWSVAQVNTAAWNSLANSVSTAVGQELAANDIRVGYDINGCSSDAGCIAFLADSATEDGIYADEYATNSFLAYLPHGQGTVWTGFDFFPSPYPASLGYSVDTSSLSDHTLMTFTASPVPIPAALPMFVLAIASLSWVGGGPRVRRK